MANLLDFEDEKHEKGYKQFSASRENFKANIGKKICYVDFVERHRGTYFVRYGIIHSVRYSTLYLNDMNQSVDIRNIKDCGIEIDKQTE